MGQYPALCGIFPPPLAKADNIAEIESYPWPDYFEKYRYAGIAEEVAGLRAKGFAVYGGPHEFFEIAWQLRSMERLMEDMLLNPEMAHAVYDRILERNVRLARECALAGMDILSLGDDVAMQNGIMMSPELWRQYLGPGMQAMIGEAPLKPGAHSISLEEADKYFKITCILDDSAADLQEGMGVAGQDGRIVKSEIVFRIEIERPVSGLQVTANVTAVRDLGGKACISFSDDGNKWSEPVCSDNDAKKQNYPLTVRRALADENGPEMAQSIFEKGTWWVRVQLQATAGKKTNTAAKLQKLEITAAVEPRLN